MNLFKKIYEKFSKKTKRKVLVHCPSGDIFLTVEKDNIIKVPWITSYCPFHLEEDWSVTLRLIWGDVPSRGYGKVWDLITWEQVGDNENEQI